MELEDTNRQLIVANERAEESSKMKSNFIINYNNFGQNQVKRFGGLKP